MRNRVTREQLLTLATVALAWTTAVSTVFQYDDFRVVVDNPDVHTWRAWVASMPGIRPLTKASFTLNWTLSRAPSTLNISGSWSDMGAIIREARGRDGVST